MWSLTFPILPKKEKNRPRSHDVINLGKEELPSHVRDLLSNGPKFCRNPRIVAPESIINIHKMAAKVTPGNYERCVLEGMDCLLGHRSPTTVDRRTKAVVFWLRSKELRLMVADKQGVFFVVLGGVFCESALQGINKNFKNVKNASHTKVREAAKNLCKKMELCGLANAIAKGEARNLNIFCSVKTHKVGNPFQVIVVCEVRS